MDVIGYHQTHTFRSCGAVQREVQTGFC